MLLELAPPPVPLMKSRIGQPLAGAGPHGNVIESNTSSVDCCTASPPLTTISPPLEMYGNVPACHFGKRSWPVTVVRSAPPEQLPA